ncbi:MAG: carboxypeptidase-like regulatory domain-containing protein [Halobacteriota archaeon]
MNRMTLIAIVLCALLLTTLGAGVVTAKQDAKASQKDKYQFDVTLAGSTKVVGKLVIDTAQQTLSFKGHGLTAGQTYYLVCKDSMHNIGQAAASTAGLVQIEGALSPWVPNPVAHPTFILATSPLVGGTLTSTRTTITVSPTAAVPGGSVTVKAHVEKFDAASNAWIPAQNAGVELQRTAQVETTPVMTHGWSSIGGFGTLYFTDQNGNVQQQVTLPSSIGYMGFKAWQHSDETLGASMSGEQWIGIKHTAHWFDQPYQPDQENRLVVFLVPIGWATTVGGRLLDEHNNPVANAKVEVFQWSTKQPVATVTTDKYGIFKWGTDKFFSDTPPPDMGVRYLGDSNYRGIPDWKCPVTNVYPPPPS